jgi:hypothetical protein
MLLQRSAASTTSVSPAFDVEEGIRMLCEMDIEKAKGNAKTSGVSLEQLKLMAVHLQLAKTQKKEKLVHEMTSVMLLRQQYILRCHHRIEYA